jgi:hypothetical protein
MLPIQNLRARIRHHKTIKICDIVAGNYFYAWPIDFKKRC